MWEPTKSYPDREMTSIVEFLHTSSTENNRVNHNGLQNFQFATYFKVNNGIQDSLSHAKDVPKDCSSEECTSHDNIVSKALCTTAVKHWVTCGVKFGVSRYSNTQLNALFDLFNVDVAESMPPLQLKRSISRKATARRYVAFTPEIKVDKD